MAYVFNKTLNLLGENPPEAEKTDIFSQQETGNPQPQSQPQNNIKTSVEGSLSGTNPSSGAGAQQALQRSSLVAPKSQVIKANVGNVKIPTAANEAIGQIKAASEGLQNEANQYATGYQKTTAPTQEQISQAIGGDAVAQSAVSGVLNKNILEASEKFKPKQDINIELANEFSTPQGIQNVLQRSNDEEYTKGMGALDLALLGQSPDFAKTMEAIGKGQKELYSQADKAKTDLEAQRLANEQASATQAKTSTQNILESEAEKAQNPAKSAEKAFDNQIAYYQGLYTPTPAEKKKWDKDLNDYIASTSGDLLNQTKQMYGGFDFGNFLTPEVFNTVDPRQFVTYNVAPTDYTQFMDQDSVNRYNNIMALLGKGQGMTRGLTPGGMFGLDNAAYQQAIIDAARKAKQQQEGVDAWNKAGGLEPEPQGRIVPPAPPPEIYIPGTTNIPIDINQVGNPGQTPLYNTPGPGITTKPGALNIGYPKIEEQLKKPVVRANPNRRGNY